MKKLHVRQRVTIVLSLLLMPILLLAQEGTEKSVPSTIVEDLERAALATIQNCEADIARFCGDVTPGESRVFSCLHGYADQVSPACEESLRVWRGPDWERDFHTTQIYPTLEQRELGEPNIDDDGERVIWQRKLPFMAQQVVDLGFELPNPYGIAIIPARIRQDLILENLAIGVNGPPDREIDFVDFGTPNVENSAMQLPSNRGELREPTDPPSAPAGLGPKAQINPSGRAILRNMAALLPPAKLYFEHDAGTEVALPLFLDQLPGPG